MDICKNKESGQHFIYIGESGNEEALFVTPNSEIKSLKSELFYDPVNLIEEHLLKEKIVTSEQIRRFTEYRENRSDEMIENVEYQFDQLSSWEQEKFLRKLQQKIEMGRKMK